MTGTPCLKSGALRRSRSRAEARDSPGPTPPAKAPTAAAPVLVPLPQEVEEQTAVPGAVPTRLPGQMRERRTRRVQRQPRVHLVVGVREKPVPRVDPGGLLPYVEVGLLPQDRM